MPGQPPSGQPLLEYRTSTNPAPLQAGSGPGDPTENRVNIAVRAPANRKVYCKEIQIAVPIRSLKGGAYFSAKPQCATGSDKWQDVTAATGSGGLALGNTSDYHQFVFRPIPAMPKSRPVDYPLDFGLTGRLDTPTGPLTCIVTETSRTGGGSYATRRRELTLTVTDPVFYLHNFRASDPNQPTVPRTRFNAGEDVHLAWESNGTHFQLYDGDGTLLNQGSEDKTSCTVPKSKVTNDTTYTLVASVSSGPQGGQAGFQPICQYATLTITLNNPTLTGVRVNGDAVVQGIRVDGLAGIEIGAGGLRIDDASKIFGTPYKVWDSRSSSTRDGRIDRSGFLVGHLRSDDAGGDDTPEQFLWIKVDEYDEYIQVNTQGNRYSRVLDNTFTLPVRAGGHFWIQHSLRGWACVYLVPLFS